MDDFRVDPAAHTPPSVQIVEHLLDALSTGRFAAGDKLPSVRSLAVDVLVNPNTVAKAYAELERQGVVAGRNGSGVYVTAEGPDHARSLRRASTLQDFVRTTAAALRAGHDAEALRLALVESSNQASRSTDTHCETPQGANHR